MTPSGAASAASVCPHAPATSANANPTTSDVAWTFGGINAEWAATSWLRFNENLGYDYSNDERFQSWAWSNSNGAPPARSGTMWSMWTLGAPQRRQRGSSRSTRRRIRAHLGSA